LGGGEMFKRDRFDDGEKMSLPFRAGVLEARGHNFPFIDPVKNLLAGGHSLESPVDIAEPPRRIAASR
ncbi:hypothetical protein Q2378_24995, partial [Escherichia coli]|nr:hypothetical protein [Escherichia coli]